MPVAPVQISQMDTSLNGWVKNAHSTLSFPTLLLTVVGLIVAGTFAEKSPRKDILFLNSVIGTVFLYCIPLIITAVIDWPTGLLAATVSLIFIARLNKQGEEEGFNMISPASDEFNSTKIIGTSQRWFVEKVLGEVPIAISADKIITRSVSDYDNRTSSSSSMSGAGSSDTGSSR